jgi:hypothetical protein
MKQQFSRNLALTSALALPILCALSFSTLAAENTPAPDNQAIPKGCVKLEDEIKFTGKNVFFSELGHLTAGKLEVEQLNKVDPNAADVIRKMDEIPNLKDDEKTLITGEVTLESTNLSNDPAPVKFENEPMNPRTSISMQIQSLEGEGANITGSIKLKPQQIFDIKFKYLDIKALDTPIAVCGVGMQLYLSREKKKINRGSLILYIHQGSDKTVPIEALNNNRGNKPAGQISTEIVSEPDSKVLDTAGRAL